MSLQGTSDSGRVDPTRPGTSIPMSLLSRVNDVVERVLLWLVTAMFVSFICVVVLQVLGRNLLRFLTLLWTIDVALMMFIWSVYLGSALAVRRNVHYIIELVPPKLLRTNAVLDIIAALLVFVVLYVFVFVGVEYLENAATRVSLAIGLSQVYFYLAIPVAGAAMTLFLVEVVIERLKALPRVFRDEGG